MLLDYYCALFLACILKYKLPLKIDFEYFNKLVKFE